MVTGMIQIRQTGAVALTLLAVFSGYALAEGEPTQIGTFEGWVAYSYDAADSKVCYVSATPAASEPKNAKRDPAFFLVTHMPGRKPPVKGEVSTIIGYPFKEGQPVKLTIDDASYDMFSKGDTAWVDTGSDKKIVAAMKAGKSLKVQGISWRGTQTVDTYSLSGISAALAAIDKACN
jgi:invasion protein IalB